MEGLHEPEKEEPYFHFPMAMPLAQLLVRVPAALRSSMEDVATAKADYSKLDVDGNAVRIRLGATVVNTKQNHAAGSQASGVSVAYARDGKLRRATARHCVLACYNAMVPYLCPELPAAQKKALHYCVKLRFL
jgi:spermidine dehydrogenase